MLLAVAVWYGIVTATLLTLLGVLVLAQGVWRSLARPHATARPPR